MKLPSAIVVFNLLYDWAVDLTRSQCTVSDTQVTVKAHRPLVRQRESTDNYNERDNLKSFARDVTLSDLNEPKEYGRRSTTRSREDAASHSPQGGEVLKLQASASTGRRPPGWTGPLHLALALPQPQFETVLEPLRR